MPPSNEAKSKVAELLSYDNLFKIVAAGLFGLGSWLWTDLNAQLDSLATANANLGNQVVDLRLTLENKED
mgnify:CR=1 FL=1